MPEKIKILQVITRLDKGGSAELALLVCRNINRKNYETTLAYGQSPSSDYSTCDVNCVYLPRLKRDISPLNDLIAAYDVYRLLLRERPGIVQTNSSKAGFIGRWAAWLYNKTARAGNRDFKKAVIIHMPHGHVFYGYGFSRLKTMIFLALERATAKITDKLIAITEGEKKESLEFKIGRPEQWTIIHPGVECAAMEDPSVRKNARRDLGIPEGAVVAGTVARFEPVKGVIYLVEAAAVIAKHAGVEMRYLLVGDGSQMDIIKKTASALGVLDKVVFTGMSNDVPRLMSAMDIFVQPSLNEGMGKTLVQAHSQGLPIVATRVQGIPDVVVDGVTGFLVPPADPGRLAEKILELTGSQELREKMGNAGKEWVNHAEEGFACFSEERTVRQFETLYENLLK